MKTISEPSVISPAILILAALAAAILLITLKGVKLPLLSNPKVALGVLIVLGMTICTQGGIGRIAAVGNWAHPQAILGYILGTSILLVAASVFFNLKLPFITSQQQAFLVIAALLGTKVINAFAHYYLLSRR
jgi:hypothetical protein